MAFSEIFALDLVFLRSVDDNDFKSGFSVDCCSELFKSLLSDLPSEGVVNKSGADVDVNTSGEPVEPSSDSF